MKILFVTLILLSLSITRAELIHNVPEIGAKLSTVKADFVSGRICLPEDHAKIDDKTVIIYCQVEEHAWEKAKARNGILDTVYIGDAKVLGIKYLFPPSQFQQLYDNAKLEYGKPTKDLNSKDIAKISQGLPGEIATYFDKKNRRTVLRLVKNQNFFATEILQFELGTSNQNRVDNLSKVISRPVFY